MHNPTGLRRWEVIHYLQRPMQPVQDFQFVEHGRYGFDVASIHRGRKDLFEHPRVLPGEIQPTLESLVDSLFKSGLSGWAQAHISDGVSQFVIHPRVSIGLLAGALDVHGARKRTSRIAV